MRKAYDIVVIGGGMSGVSAAVSAARRGLDVLLVESTSTLGGMGTAGMITMMMTSRKWFYGLGKALIEDMILAGDARRIKKPAVEGYDYYPYDAEAMKRKLDTLVLDSGVTLLLGTRLIAASERDGHITSVTLAGAEGLFEVCADVFIDASGDAALAQFCGEDILYGDENGNIQAPTMIAYYAGIDFARYEQFLASFEDGKHPAKINMIHSLIPRAVEDGVLSIADLHHPGVFRISEEADIGLMNAGHVYGADLSNSAGLTDATVCGRRMAKEYLDFYHRYIPGFEKAYMTNTGSLLAIREGNRVQGLYTMRFEDKAKYRKFEDAVMRMDGGAVSDLHASSPDKEAYEAYRKLFDDRDKVRLDDFATLPLRSLLGRKHDNLLLAGRCVSADRKVLGQIRIMGYCFMMGEAAGICASISVKNGVPAVQVAAKDVQNALLENGIPTL